MSPFTLPTTRYRRFLYRRDRYVYRRNKWWNKKWKWHKDPVTGHRTKEAVPVEAPGPRQLPHGVSSASYNALPLHIIPSLTFTVTADGFAKPPHVKITSGFYLFMRAAGHHQHNCFLRYHAKRLRAFRGHCVLRRQNKRDRQITGCNYFYFRNQFFSDTDILGRRPNQTDIDNGAPFGPAGWPVPLGY